MKEISETYGIMNIKYSFFDGTNKRYDMAFKDSNRGDIWKMGNDYVPRIYPIREETIHVSTWFTSYFMKCIVVVVPV